jgi:hypothetical protein
MRRRRLQRRRRHLQLDRLPLLLSAGCQLQRDQNEKDNKTTSKT